MEKVQWKVSGMDCNNCALTIRRYLEKEGMKEVKVNFATGDVSFETVEADQVQEAAKGVEDLGYTVAGSEQVKTAAVKSRFLSTQFQRFLFCLPFTLIRSASCCTGGFSPCAWRTIWMMPASTVSFPAAVT